MKLVRIAAVAAAVGLLAAFAGVGRPEGASSAAGAEPRAITVNGTGIVTSVPDRADFTFGVSTNAKTATAALNANAAEMTKVINALKAEAIPAADIQTASISLQPRYNAAGDDIVGYTASNSVTAHLRSLAKAGAIVDAAVAAGANQVSGPSLTRTDQQALYQRALRAAIVDARKRAQAIASASHVRLGPVRMVTEGSNVPPPPILAGRAQAPSATPVEPGTIQIEADVMVTFGIS